MMGIWAIIPVKSLQDSKQRLAHVLTAEQRSALMLRLFHRVLAALDGVSAVEQVLVISPDPHIHDCAAWYGALVEKETGNAGLVTAVTRGAARARLEGATGVLLLPADLPLVEPADIAALFAPLGHFLTEEHPVESEPHMVICGDDREDGTNGLLLLPARAFTFQYGPGSFQKHLAEAQARNIRSHIIRTPGLSFDLDTEDDWRQVQSLTV